MSSPRHIAPLALLTAALLFGSPRSAAGDDPPAPSPPRKVIVGTSMYGMWGPYPGLSQRLAQLGGLIDDMAAQAQAKYGRSIDIAALPEVAVSGGAGYGPAGAFPLAGQVQDYFAAKARQHNCYVLVPLYLSEQLGGATVCYNACALLDRAGALMGIYRKVHAVSAYESELLEGGVLPGDQVPVFQCDFGKVGIQICYDMSYDDTWRALEWQGAELVIWSTQSPGQRNAARRALDHRYFVVSSTWRNNASLFDPTGALLRSITNAADRVFAEEIDLEYALLPWQPALNNGAIFDTAYPGKVGYRYSEAEDEGIFWSKDPQKPIMQMVRELGLSLTREKVEKDRRIQDQLRGGPLQMPIGPLTVSGVLDWQWVYQNTPLTTAGRHASALAVFVSEDPNRNASYSVTVTADPASIGAVAIVPTSDPLLWTIRGGERGTQPAGPVALNVTVMGTDVGGQGTACAKLTVRLLGDIDGNGSVGLSDKPEMSKCLNGLPTPGYELRHFDLNGGGTVGLDDKLILNKVLNGLAVP